METDAEIIRSCARRPEAFETIFDRHYGAIRGYLVRRLGIDDGEELAAETFTTALGHLDRYDLDRPSARPWLYGIATNLLSHHLRSRSRGRVAYARAFQHPVTEISQDDLVARVDADGEAALVLDALQGLDGGDRDVVLLVAWEGLSYGDVAQALDIPVGTVRSRMHRARKHVRAQLSTASAHSGKA